MTDHDEQATTIVLTGGCQCGAVRYTARATSRDAYYCHCRMCQRAFGNIFATFVHIQKADLVWDGREPAYFAPTSFSRRGFCPSCGTPLSFEYLEGDGLDLSIGSLDDPDSMRPKLHFGVESRLAEFHVPDGLPEKRTDEAEHIVKKWRAAYGEDVQLGVVPRSSGQ